MFLARNNKELMRVMDSFKNNRISYIKAIFTVILLMVMLCYVARAGYVALVTDVPRECRDVANVQMTQAIVDGDNPFEIKDNILKQFAYVYTPLNSIIVALIHKITHVGIVRLHYVVDFLYIFMSAVLLSWYVYKRKKDLFWTIVTFGFSWMMGCRMGFISAIPDHLATLIWIVMLLILEKNKIDHKVVAVLSVLSVLLFYAKQYFVVVALAVFIYLCIKKWRYAFFYAIECMLIGSISLVVINHFFPLFCIYELFFFSVQCNTIGMSNVMYSLAQFKYILGAFAVCWIACLVYTAKKVIVKERMHANIWAVSSLVMVIPLLYLGTNTGASLSYHLQLWAPQLVVCGMIAAQEVCDALLGNRKNILVMCCWIFAMFNVGLYVHRLCTAPILNEEQIADWNKANGYIDDSVKAGKVLVMSMEMGYRAIGNEQVDLYDNGHNYLAEIELIEKDVSDSLVVMVLDQLHLLDEKERLGKLMKKRDSFYESLIKENVYEMIVIPQNSPFNDFVDSTQYKLVDEITLFTGGEQNISLYYKRAK